MRPNSIRALIILTAVSIEYILNFIICFCGANNEMYILFWCKLDSLEHVFKKLSSHISDTKRKMVAYVINDNYVIVRGTKSSPLLWTRQQFPLHYFSFSPQNLKKIPNELISGSGR